MQAFDGGPRSGEALIEYGDGEFRMLRPGAYVLCAVTGKKISLDALRYWSVDLQEAYVDASAATKAMNGAGV